MRGLRIAMIADVAPNPNSGAAGSELALARELELAGHEIVPVWGDEIRHRIRHWNLHHLFEQPLEYRRRIRELRSEVDFDVLHVNQPAGWLAARELRRTGWSGLFAHRSQGFEPRIAEVVRRWSRVYPQERRSLARRWASAVLRPLLTWSHRAILRWADVHVVSCRECAEDLVERGVREDRIVVLAHAAPDTFLELPAPPMEEDRLRRLLVVGQYAHFKAPMVAVEVLRRALEADPRLEATWVCEERAHDRIRGSIGPELAQRLRLHGWTGQDRLREIYDSHGIFLFTSFTEGFGNVFLEAMARGLCVVSTRQGGARDWIRHGVDGVLTPVGDPVAMTTEVLALANDLARARRIGASARQRALELTWARAAKTLAAFYREALERKRLGRPTLP